MKFDWRLALISAGILLGILILASATLMGLTNYIPCEWGIDLPTMDCGLRAPMDAHNVIKIQLREVQTVGYEISAPKEAAMKKGEVISVGEIAAASSIAKETLRFTCQPSALICHGSDAPLEVVETLVYGSITARQQVDAYFVACGDDSIGKYCIGIGRESKEARTACTQGCAMS